MSPIRRVPRDAWVIALAYVAMCLLWGIIVATVLAGGSL